MDGSRAIAASCVAEPPGESKWFRRRAAASAFQICRRRIGRGLYREIWDNEVLCKTYSPPLQLGVTAVGLWLPGPLADARCCGYRHNHASGGRSHRAAAYTTGAASQDARDHGETSSNACCCTTTADRGANRCR